MNSPVGISDKSLLSKLNVLYYSAMKPTVYIESTVISYYTARPSRDLIVAAHQQITQDWWDAALPKFEPFISQIVLDEISQGDAKAVEKRVEASSSFPILETIPEVKELSDIYFKSIDIPDKARADTYHLTLAVWHGMDYLVTWNCTHIAGGRVKMIVDNINTSRNIKTPIICTPEELMEG